MSWDAAHAGAALRGSHQEDVEPCQIGLRLAYFHVWTPRRLGFHFYESPENVIEMVPEYYGLPSISMRNAMYHMVANIDSASGLDMERGTSTMQIA